MLDMLLGLLVAGYSVTVGIMLWCERRSLLNELRRGYGSTWLLITACPILAFVAIRLFYWSGVQWAK